MRITTPERLIEITRLLHDHWFDLDRAERDETDRTLRLPFQPKPRESFAGGWLTIGNVTRVEILDTEKIGFYDLNEIHYDADAGRITITTGVPLGLQIFVDELNVEYGSA